MRIVKWISMLTIVAMLCAALPVTVAEDEIVIEMEAPAEDTQETELSVEPEGLDILDAPAFEIEEANLELDGLADNPLISGDVDQGEIPAVINAGSEFDIDEDGTLIRYGGFATNVVIPDGVKAIGDSAFSG